MAKARPWACFIACILTALSALVLLIAAGIYCDRGYYLRNYWGVLYSFSICTIILAVFAIIFSVGLAYVAFRRFPALTTLFSGLLILIAVLSAICAIVFAASRAHIRSKTVKETFSLLADYTPQKSHESSKDAIDRVQQTYDCCGMDQALDWAQLFPDGKSTPDSCCRTVTDGCGTGSLVVQNTIYIRGCVEPLISEYRLRYTVLIGMHINLIFFAVLSAVLGLIFERYIREQYQLM